MYFVSFLANGLHSKHKWGRVRNLNCTAVRRTITFTCYGGWPSSFRCRKEWILFMRQYTKDIIMCVLLTWYQYFIFSYHGCHQYWYVVTLLMLIFSNLPTMSQFICSFSRYTYLKTDPKFVTPCNFLKHPGTAVFW